MHRTERVLVYAWLVFFGESCRRSKEEKNCGVVITAFFSTANFTHSRYEIIKYFFFHWVSSDVYADEDENALYTGLQYHPWNRAQQTKTIGLNILLRNSISAIVLAHA